MKKIIFTTLFVFMCCIASAATQTIKIITFLPAGAAAEVSLRKIAEEVSIKRNQPIIIENKPGAGGLIAAQAFFAEPKDALTLFQGDVASVAVTPTLNNFQLPMEELVPLLGFIRATPFLVVPSNVKDFNELMTLIKKKPTYGSWGIGSVPHLLGLEFAEQMKIDSTHVLYKEWNQWYVDLSNGELGFSFSTYPSTSKFIKMGKLKFLAIVSPIRDPRFPEVPTFHELTGKKLDYLKPIGTIFSRKSLGTEFNQQIAKYILTAYNTKEVMSQIADQGYDPADFLHGDELNNVLKIEWALNKKLLSDFNIKIK